MEIKIIDKKQGNKFYNPDKSYDGGGYDQPIYTFEYNRIIGEYDNSSCGIYGKRYKLQWNNKRYSYDSVNKSWPQEYSSFSKNDPQDVDFVKAFQNFKNIEIKFKEEL